MSEMEDNIFYRELSNKKYTECLPRLLPDSVIDFLLKYKTNKDAHELFRQYSVGLYCYSMNVKPSDLTNKLLDDDKVYVKYYLNLLLERLNRLSLIRYKAATIETLYSIDIKDIQYIKTSLAERIFPSQAR